MTGLGLGSKKTLVHILLKAIFVLSCPYLILFTASISIRGDTMQSGAGSEIHKELLLGDKAASQNNLVQAKEHYLLAIETWKKLTFNTEAEKIFYKQQIKNAYLSLGLIDTQLERFPEAIDSYKHVIELGDNPDKALTYMLMGRVHKLTGSYSDSMKCFQLSAEIYKKIEATLTTEDKFGLAEVSLQLADYKIALLDYSKAEKDIEKALEIFDKLNYQEEKVQAYWSIGQGPLETGNYDQCLMQFKTALEVAEKMKQEALILKSHLQLVFAYATLGDLDKAREEFKKADQRKNIEDEVNHLRNMWHIFSYLGYRPDEDRAVESEKKYLEKSIELCELNEALKISIEFASALKARASWRIERKEFKRAEEDLTIAIAIFKSKGLPRHEATSLMDLAWIYIENKDFRKAVEILKPVKDLLHKEGMVEMIAGINNSMALALFKANDFEDALEVLKENEAAAPQKWWNKWTTYLALGGVLEKKEKLEEAHKNLKEAVQLLENFRLTLRLEDLRTGFAKDKTLAYQKIVGVLYKLKRFDEALEYADRAKCHILSEQLALTKLRRPKELEGTKLAKEEEELLEYFRLCQSQARRTNISSALETTTILAEKEEELSKIWVTMAEEFKNTSPVQEYLSLRHGDVIEVKKLSKIIQERFGSAALVEYFLGKLDDKNVLFIFVIGSKDGKVKAEYVPLTDEFKKYTESLDETSEGKLLTGRRDWRELGRWLIEPIKEHIKEYKVLCIIPDGNLSNIPIQALYTKDNRYLMETHAVVYYPSATVIEYISSRERGGKGVLTIANPTEDKDIAFSEYEALNINTLFEREGYAVEPPYIGREVTKDFLKEKWSNKDIIHLACHGEFVQKTPLSSSIQLADGLLTAKEIYEESLNSNLVVLSACETAKSAERAGELYGLPRAFVYAGTSSLICTLWKVKDISTTMLLEKFYEELVHAKPATTIKAEALRRAQKYLSELPEEKVIEYLEKVKNTPEDKATIPFQDLKEKIETKKEQIKASQYPFADPYYWAPFVLIGN